MCKENNNRRIRLDKICDNDKNINKTEKPLDKIRESFDELIEKWKTLSDVLGDVDCDDECDDGYDMNLDVDYDDFVIDVEHTIVFNVVNAKEITVDHIYAILENVPKWAEIKYIEVDEDDDLVSVVYK